MIAVSGFVGFHGKYLTSGWLAGSTLAEDLDISEVEFDVAASTLFAIGNIIKIGNELCYVSSIASGKVTVTKRGENGSTAAIHLSGANVYIWQIGEEVKSATLEITNNAYKRRFGVSGSMTETITGAGVVLSPRDIPPAAVEFIRSHRQIT